MVAFQVDYTDTREVARYYMAKTDTATVLKVDVSILDKV